MLALWSIFTFLLFLCTLALNAALATLFFLLTITFALLSAGVMHETADKVGGAGRKRSPPMLAGILLCTLSVASISQSIESLLVRNAP